MGSFAEGLPNRFPVGTRYVVEGHGGAQGALRIHLRYLEFPDGRQVKLPADVAHRTRSQRRRGARALGAENNFAHRKPGRDLGVEPTAPGGVPPSPQPLTHPAIRPWPFWPGSSFLGGAARNRRIRGGGLCPPDKPRVLSRVAVATDDV